MNLLKYIWPWSQLYEQQDTLQQVLTTAHEALDNFKDLQRVADQMQTIMNEQEHTIERILQRNKEVIAQNRSLSAQLSFKTPAGLQDPVVEQPRKVDVAQRGPWPGMAEHMRRQREAEEALGAEANVGPWPFPRSAP